MADDDELMAEVEHLLLQLADEGHLELASRRGASSLAARMVRNLAGRGDDFDIGDWLVEQVECSELYIDTTHLRERLAHVYARRDNDEPEPLHNPVLAAAIAKDPNDEKAWLVYADWLSERGDPRGELIMIQARLDNLKRNDHDERARLVAAEKALLARHRTHFYGEEPASEDVAITFRYGFFDRVTVDEAGVILDFLEVESARFLRTLVTKSAVGAAEAVSILTRAQILSTLVIGTWVEGASRVDVAKAVAPHPRLELFITCAARIDVEKLTAPSLERLELHGGTLSLGDEASIAGATRLEALVLDLPSVIVDDVARVFFATAPPSLTSLTIPAACVPALARSPLRHQVRTLDLSQNRDEWDVEELVASKGALTGLERLIVEGNRLDGDASRAISAAFPRVDFRPPPHAWVLDLEGD